MNITQTSITAEETWSTEQQKHIEAESCLFYFHIINQDVAGSVIQDSGMVVFEDVLRTVAVAW